MEPPAISRPPVSRFLRRALAWLAKAVAAVAAGIVALLPILLGVMWREHKTAMILPTPTGRFAVGRTTYVWTDESTEDEFAPTPGSKRQVLVWIWYPASRSQRDVPAEYLPAEWRAAQAKQLGVVLRSFVKHDPALVHTHSVSGEIVSPERRSYPVVLLRAGGSALTTDFTTLAEDLASHGFIVVGFDAPYRSFFVVLPDGRVVARAPAANLENAGGDRADPLIGKLLAMWTSDTRFVVDQLRQLNDAPSGRFASRMDLQRLGMFGHSFGGATALEFCHQDSRCRAALDVDGIPFGSVVPEGLSKPCMFLLSDHSREMADLECTTYRVEPSARAEYLAITVNGPLGIAPDVSPEANVADLVLAAMEALDTLETQAPDDPAVGALTAYVRRWAPIAALSAVVGEPSASPPGRKPPAPLLLWRLGQRKAVGM